MDSFPRKMLFLFAALLANGCPSNGSTSASNAGTKDLDAGSGAAVARGAGGSDASKTSAWHGTYSFGWSAGGSAGGGIVAVSTYKVTVSGPATRPDVVIAAEATQAMPVTYRAHGEPKSATELTVVLDACRSDGEFECSRNKVGDALVTLVSGNPMKMRFGKLRAPDETTKELVADKVATPEKAKSVEKPAAKSRVVDFTCPPSQRADGPSAVLSGCLCPDGMIHDEACGRDGFTDVEATAKGCRFTCN